MGMWPGWRIGDVAILIKHKVAKFGASELYLRYIRRLSRARNKSSQVLSDFRLV